MSLSERTVDLLAGDGGAANSPSHADCLQSETGPLVSAALSSKCPTTAYLELFRVENFNFNILNARVFHLRTSDGSHHVFNTVTESFDNSHLELVGLNRATFFFLISLDLSQQFFVVIGHKTQCNTRVTSPVAARLI